MNDIRMKVESYNNLTSYDILINALKEFIVRNDQITFVGLWFVFFIVVALSSLIILFKKKQDEVFYSSKYEYIDQSSKVDYPNVDLSILHNSKQEESSKVINYKELLTQLHYVTSKCYDTRYASKCIRLVRDCPYLINVSLEPSGLTPFQRVCYNGHTCLVEYMLAKGANTSLTTQSGENALCLAVYYCIKHPEKEDLSCLDLLFNSGCTLDTKSRWFEVVLKMATQNCQKRLTEWILVHANAAAYDQRSMSVPVAFENIKNYSQYKHRVRR